jgi:hypothetical protein
MAKGHDLTRRQDDVLRIPSQGENIDERMKSVETNDPQAKRTLSVMERLAGFRRCLPREYLVSSKALRSAIDQTEIMC